MIQPVDNSVDSPSGSWLRHSTKSTEKYDIAPKQEFLGIKAVCHGNNKFIER